MRPRQSADHDGRANGQRERRPRCAGCASRTSQRRLEPLLPALGVASQPLVSTQVPSACRPVPARRYGRPSPPRNREAHAAGIDPAPVPQIPIEHGMPRIGRLGSGPPSARRAPRPRAGAAQGPSTARPHRGSPCCMDGATDFIAYSIGGIILRMQPCATAAAWRPDWQRRARSASDHQRTRQSFASSAT